MVELFFLSGIARSGSTLLGSILNQNPDIYTSPTSPLMDMYCFIDQKLNDLTLQYTYDYDKVSSSIQKDLYKNFYSHIKKKYIIDKHRGWPRNIQNIKKFITLNPKIICTWRPLSENITSFLKLMENDPENIIDKQLKERNLALTTENRAQLLWLEYSSDPYYSLKHGLENNPNNIHIVKYNDLIENPKIEIQKIYEFLQIKKYNHTYDNIVNTCQEDKDENWGFKNLHTIRNKLEKQSNDPNLILGYNIKSFFDNLDNQLKFK